MTSTLSTTPPSMPRGKLRARRALTGIGLALLAASAVFGFDPYGIRGRVLGTALPDARPPAASRSVADEATPAATAPAAAPAPDATPTQLRSQPWWQELAAVEGNGPSTTSPLTVHPSAIQWRVRWTCQSGHLRVGAPASGEPVVDASCPGEGRGYGTATGELRLAIAADGPWTLHVEQQIDLPLSEPPLPGMTEPGARRVASGEFYRIDQFGDGRASIFQLPEGGYALRLEDFYVTPNSDLTIELNPLSRPRTTDETQSVPVVEVAALDVTAGTMNFRLPPGVDPTEYRSVVIWCDRLYSAYAAASLESAP